MSRLLTSLAALLVPLAIAASPVVRGNHPSRPVHDDPADVRQVDRLIVSQTNDFRRSQGLAPTGVNAQLTATAQAFAEFMARTDRYGHEADGRQPAQRATAQGYAYCLVSENIAMQFNSAGFETDDLAQRFVDGWKQSPGHRRNMLERSAVDIGVAVTQSPRTGRYYAVQMFGRPAAMRTSFRIANRSTLTLSYEIGGETFRLPPRMTRTHEQCSADVLSVHVPGQSKTLTVEPADGERYAVERVGPAYRLTKG